MLSSVRSPRINFLMCRLRSDSVDGGSKLTTLPTRHPQEFRQHLQHAASVRRGLRSREGHWDPPVASVGGATNRE